MTQWERVPMRLHHIAREKCDNAIIITGAARSGTTTMAKLIHSMKGVECAIESTIIPSLVAFSADMAHNAWEGLYETYLYQEVLCGSVAGRTINPNREDESSIYKVKSPELIEARLSQSIRQRDIEGALESSRIAYKLVCFAPFIPKIQKSYPHTQVVMMLRDPDETIHSGLERQWFSNAMLRTQNLLGPGYFVEGVRIPYWVELSHHERWLQWDELHRVAYYYVRAYQDMAKIDNMVTVRYEDLCREPSRIVAEVADFLHLEWEPKTSELLNEVKRLDKKREKWVDQLSPELKEMVLAAGVMEVCPECSSRSIFRLGSEHWLYCADCEHTWESEDMWQQVLWRPQEGPRGRLGRRS